MAELMRELNKMLEIKSKSVLPSDRWENRKGQPRT